VSAITETDKPGIEFGQIQGIRSTDHQLGLELEHADQIPAFDPEMHDLLTYPGFSSEQSQVVVFNSSIESAAVSDEGHVQLDLSMHNDSNVVEHTLWIDLKMTEPYFKGRNFLINSRTARKRRRVVEKI